MNLSRFKQIIHLIISLINLGCILTSKTFEYKYENPIYSEKTNKNITISVNYSESYKSFSRNKITFQGIFKDGFGIERGYIFINPQAEEIVKNLFITELKNSGFTITNLPSNDNPEIEIQVNQMFIEPEVGFFVIDAIAVIDINIFVHFKNKSFNRRFKAIGEATILLQPDYFYQLALDRSMKNLALKTIPEVISLIQDEQKDF
ncbi:hypothetical protein EHR01_06535 [Leptospira mtsangambouensis]|uniref:Lipoprotein n=1 Tax=Leptospira mtsangambouensis TaxID=2484912 RepID=A0ABY2P4J7_9LEPT|nr:YajG family lipoprotein [Leptospira mtsangambouensis]TGM82432.1 hypothetical protein EHR01_06535 [Leptospira mtsangambouensis]